MKSVPPRGWVRSDSVPFAVANGQDSSDDISSTCIPMTLSLGHSLPRTVLNTPDRGFAPTRYREVVLTSRHTIEH